MAWHWIRRNKEKLVINKKRKGIKYFFYTILKYDLFKNIEFKEDLLLNFIENMKKYNLRFLFFTFSETGSDYNKLNTLYILIWKENIIKKDKKLHDIFELVINQLNLVFNYNLKMIDEKEKQIIYEKVFPFLLI
ncbi:MAG: hypothetical protein RQ952_05205 [Thermoproteota archaeon]|jgi:hypothetical protein|nr:hypothetical protein [Thermoproteota archaeon]